MNKKIKLPFQELEKEFPAIISSEELRSILGGSYGYNPDSWGTNANSFLSNVSDMMANGMFNFSGGGSEFGASFDVSAFYSDGGSGSSVVGGSGGGGSASNFTMPSMFGNMTSGSNSFSFGQLSSNTNLFSFGSADLSGSTLGPAPLLGNFGTFTTSFVMPGGKDPSLSIQDGNKTFNFNFKNGEDGKKGTFTFGIKYNF